MATPNWAVTGMRELKSVKKGGFGGGGGREVADGWGALGERVRWTDLEEGSISSCGSSRWVARL